MTIEELCHNNADYLSSLSDEELTKHLSQYFNITRPELVVKTEHKHYDNSAPSIPISASKQRALALLAEEGVDLSFLKFKKKKK